jgi:hypothetical protein
MPRTFGVPSGLGSITRRAVKLGTRAMVLSGDDSLTHKNVGLHIRAGVL